MLSFAIRYLRCDSGVVVTASHNPKEYNGYKAYWSDGAQVVPPHDTNIMVEFNALKDFSEVKFQGVPSRVRTIGKEVEDAYYSEVLKVSRGKMPLAGRKTSGWCIRVCTVRASRWFRNA